MECAPVSEKRVGLNRSPRRQGYGLAVGARYRRNARLTEVSLDEVERIVI
jgi:hypothetical protein